MNHSSGTRLKVAVRIEADLRTARIAVLGLVTPMNLRALSVIARRAAALLPGREIVLDLTHARAAAAAIEELADPRHLLTLAGNAPGPARPCTLRILTPLAAPAALEQPCLP
jgi:hypothetical protein